MALWSSLSIVGIFGALAGAMPTITFPLNSQVPPVARISEPFSYTFSSSTFSSDLPLSYNLTDAPSWLSLQSSTRTLSGTPPPGDVGTNAVTGFNISITASDESGSITMNAILVVSTDPAPTIAIPLSAQLPSFGAFSSPSTLRYHPSTPFKFNFDPATFSGSGSRSGVNYYSVTDGNTPLPSWISFDSSSLSFSGQTPDYQSLKQPPQIFGIQLIASDVEGFSAASISFEIEVTVHLLTFKVTGMVINATAGTDINFDGLSNNIELDGLTVNATSLDSVTVQTPSWLIFDNSTLELRGIVPADAIPSNITVQATDIYGDTANATVLIDINPAIFASQIGDLNATAGSSFAYNFGSYLRNQSDIEMTVQLSPATPWITFDSQTLILSGQVPAAAPASKIGVALLATSKTSHVSSSRSFIIFIISGTTTLPSSSTLVSHLPTSTTKGLPSETVAPSSVPSHKRLSNGVIAAIAVPICLLFLLICLALCCYRQRRQAATKRPKSPTKSEISVPCEIPGSVVQVTGPRAAPTPPPLLDASGFPTEHGSSTYAHERKRMLRRLADNPLRSSQTMSAVSGVLKNEIGLSLSLRARSFSDNALSKSDRSWRSTQGSDYPVLSLNSRTNSSNRLTHIYSNYSRKGNTRRSGRIRSTDRALRDSTLNTERTQSTIQNLGNSDFSFNPLDRFSTLSNRRSKLVPGLDRSGLGYGRGSISSLAALGIKRISAGHGQDWESAGIPRDSRTWLTVNSIKEQDRLSNFTSFTENTDVLYDHQVAPLNIKQGPKPPYPPSPAYLSDSALTSRPVSKRAIGSSPFFAGGGAAMSPRKPPVKIRTSYGDSPTMPEDSMPVKLEPIEADDRRGSTTSRDSLGITYESTPGGTQGLKAYIQNRLGQTKTRGSIASHDSKDSRFHSADSLHQSQPNFVINSGRPTVEGEEAQDEYEDYLSEEFSEGSWETHHTPRDTLGNILQYGLTESPEVSMANVQRQTLMSSAAVRLHPASPLLPAGLFVGPSTAFRSRPTSVMDPDVRATATMVQGRGRRPTSVDAATNKGSVRAVVESDYSVYI